MLYVYAFCHNFTSEVSKDKRERSLSGTDDFCMILVLETEQFLLSCWTVSWNLFGFFFSSLVWFKSVRLDHIFKLIYDPPHLVPLRVRREPWTSVVLIILYRQKNSCGCTEYHGKRSLLWFFGWHSFIWGLRRDLTCCVLLLWSSSDFYLVRAHFELSMRLPRGFPYYVTRLCPQKCAIVGREWYSQLYVSVVSLCG